jgi:hypothetical protein
MVNTSDINLSQINERPSPAVPAWLAVRCAGANAFSILDLGEPIWRSTAEGREGLMTKIIMGMVVVLALAVAAPAANAKGCIKGAVVGGVAGHYVGSGHGMLGAAAGCLVGRHYAKKHARQHQMQRTY